MYPCVIIVNIYNFITMINLKNTLYVGKETLDIMNEFYLTKRNLYITGFVNFVEVYNRHKAEIFKVH